MSGHEYNAASHGSDEPGSWLFVFEYKPAYGDRDAFKALSVTDDTFEAMKVDGERPPRQVFERKGNILFAVAKTGIYINAYETARSEAERALKVGGIVSRLISFEFSDLSRPLDVSGFPF